MGSTNSLTLDTSAVLAVMRIADAPRKLMSAVSVLEATMVLEGRFGEEAGADLDVFLRRAGVEIVPFEAEQLSIARTAFRCYGKGRHRAALSFGHCVAYALSEWSGEPLLFKGSDFSATGVRQVNY